MQLINNLKGKGNVFYTSLALFFQWILFQHTSQDRIHFKKYKIQHKDP